MWRDWCRRLLRRLGKRDAPTAAHGPAQAPRMSMRDVGDGNLQVGRLQGGLHMDRSTHSSAVHVTQVTHQHFYAAPTDGARLSPEQRAVFVLMKRLRQRDYHQVLAFMRREFETALVNQLSAQQLYRLRRYVETIQRKEERERV